MVTHTFSKLHGLAALRVGWGYMPLEMAQTIDRIRQPFNTSIAAQEAAIAALADTAFKDKALALVEQWRPWLTQQLGGLGLEVTPSGRQLRHGRGFPATPAQDLRPRPRSFLASRGYLVRNVASYGLPFHLRITIGLEEHNRAVVDLLAEFLAGRAGRMTAPGDLRAAGGDRLRPDRLVRYPRRAGPARARWTRSRSMDANPAVRERVRALGIADQVFDDAAAAARDADLVIFAAPPAAIAAAALAAAPGLKAGAIISDVGSVKAAVGEALKPAAAPAESVASSSPATRSPAPSNPARTRVSPACSRTAGPSSARGIRPIRPIRRRWRGCRTSGAPWGPMSS